MNMNRRDALVGIGGIAAGMAVRKLGGDKRWALEGSDAASHAPVPVSRLADFPRKADFGMVEGFSYINGAYTHPMPLASADAYRRYIGYRSNVGTPVGGTRARQAASHVDPKEAFASLINAKPSEISYLPNTSSGENLVVECLGVARNDGNVVTDALHFDGALVHLTELQKQGLDLRIAMPRDGRIDMKDLERLVDNKTKLIEVSFVAMYNGFQHDLKAICDLAHALSRPLSPGTRD